MEVFTQTEQHKERSHMQTVRTFTVKPSLPEPLQDLQAIALPY
jgi:hypothetical protein